MTKFEAYEEYNEMVPFSILVTYEEADKYFVVNDEDPDLRPIKIKLPNTPKWEYIDGFGDKTRDQYFIKTRYPQRLIELYNKVSSMLASERTSLKNGVVTVQRIIDEVWEQLQARQLEFETEILWIKKQIWHCHYGYWFFNCGKPTYIDGWHYRFLNFWDMTDAKVEYRDRDRRWFLFQRYAYTCTEDNLGNDFGRRVCFGTTYPKHRRDGATHKALCVLYDIMTKTVGNVSGGIQSFDDDNASSHYKDKLLPAFKSMPFFLKPQWKGTQAPQAELHFTRIDNKVGDELGSKIDYATTAKKKFYDGKKLYFYLGEEEGKTILEDIDDRWDTIKFCLSQGGGKLIHGFSIHPTTVYEMTQGGGDNYERLCKSSKFHERNPETGQTKSGLFRIFIPADDGLEGFVDKYGYSVRSNPTPEQKEYVGERGAKDYIVSQLAEYEEDGSAEAMEKARELKRLLPTQYSHCFTTIGGDVGFNTELLDAAIEKLKRQIETGLPPTVKGDFKWVVEGYPYPLSSKEFIDMGFDLKKKDGKVEFFPTDKGKWELSLLLKSDQSNKKVKRDGIWYPMYPFKFTTSADPFQFLKTVEKEKRDDKSRLSKGGIATFWERDETVDPDSKDMAQWESYRFVCTYYNRVGSDDEYAEDTLMQTIYFGGEMYAERNVPLINKHFIKRGYEGYLKYEIDELTSKPKEQPGYYSLAESKQHLYKAVQRYLVRNINRERHMEFLRQCRVNKGVEYMTSYDLFTACGGCLLGSEVVRFEKDVTTPEDISEYKRMLSAMPMFRY